MPDFKINEEYLKLIKIVSDKNNITQDEVVETAVAMFLKTYFMRFDMFHELEIVRREHEHYEITPEEIKEKINNDKSTVDSFIEQAERLGLI